MIDSDTTYDEFCLFMDENFSSIIDKTIIFGNKKYYHFLNNKSSSNAYIVVGKPKHSYFYDYEYTGLSVGFTIGKPFNASMPFEQFFELLDDDKKEKFLFHLDIFSKF